MTQNETSESTQSLEDHLKLMNEGNREAFEDHLRSQEYESAILILQEEITRKPLASGLFYLLGDVYEKAGMLGESIVAYDRALHLREIAGRYEPTPDVWHLKDLHRYAENSDVALELDGLVFPRLIFTGEGEQRNLVGRCLDGDHFLKVKLKSSEREKKRWSHEITILERLQKEGCRTVPRIVGKGTVPTSTIKRAIDPVHGQDIQPAPNEMQIEYVITDFLRKDPTPSYGDIALAILEQKRCGVYIGSVRESSLRYNAERGICYLVGFKDAVVLDQREQGLTPKSFFEWGLEYEKERLSKRSKTARSILFGNRKTDHSFWGIFREQSLNLSATTSFREQLTTQHQLKAYHSFRTEELSIEGEVEFDQEFGGIIDQIFPMREGERVLDVGCAGALYSCYIARKGCKVSGIDLDHQLMNGCNVMASILDLPMRFKRLNLDYEYLDEKYDTACLFNVMNFFRDPEAVAKKLVQIIQKRFLLVMALDEKGYRPRGNYMEPTTGWEFDKVEDLEDWLEDLFTGFFVIKKPVQLSDDRYFIELASREQMND